MDIRIFKRIINRIGGLLKLYRTKLILKRLSMHLIKDIPFTNQDMCPLKDASVYTDTLEVEKRRRG